MKMVPQWSTCRLGDADDEGSSPAASLHFFFSGRVSLILFYMGYCLAGFCLFGCLFIHVSYALELLSLRHTHTATIKTIFNYRRVVVFISLHALPSPFILTHLLHSPILLSSPFSISVHFLLSSPSVIFLWLLWRQVGAYVCLHRATLPFTLTLL